MMKSAAIVTLVALAAACATSPRAVPDDTPPPPEPPDTAEAPPPAAVAPRPIASPRDSASLRLGDVTISVNYGRPYMRGRTIFGELVPYGQFWRTGANEATAFSTTSNLEMDGVLIPAGSYTLYSLLEGADDGTVREWTLVINRQTGQWGTVYDQERDLARIPMRVTRLQQPVEQFTIGLTGPHATMRDGRIVMEWERTQGTLDFRIAG